METLREIICENVREGVAGRKKKKAARGAKRAGLEAGPEEARLRLLPA